jgi:hypothetical protein
MPHSLHPVGPARRRRCWRNASSWDRAIHMRSSTLSATGIPKAFDLNRIADDATRQDAACFYFSIIASAAAIRSSSGSLMQCSVSLALSDNSFSTSITAGSCSGK